MSQLTTRPASFDDVDAVVELVNEERRAQTGESATTAGNLRSRWSQPGISLEHDTLLVLDSDSRLSGYIGYDNTREPRSRPYANLSIAPRADPALVGPILVRFLEERSRADLPSLPPDVRVTTLAWALEQNQAVLGSLAAAGFSETRRFYQMRIDFGDSPDHRFDYEPPAGYEIRTMRDGEARETFRAMDESFLDHYGHADTDDSEEAYQMWRHRFLEGEDVDRSLYFVAVDEEGTIAGVSFCRPRRAKEHSTGWVDVLGVRREHRRVGLGAALLHHSFRAMRDMGKERVGLGVDASSITRATALYERCGMHVHTTTIQMGKILRDGREAANLG